MLPAFAAAPLGLLVERVLSLALGFGVRRHSVCVGCLTNANGENVFALQLFVCTVCVRLLLRVVKLTRSDAGLL